MTEPSTSRPSAGAVFLDRDGVIIENRDEYVRSWQDVRFLPGALYALRTLATRGRPVVLITNQSSVGRGIMTAENAVNLHRRIVAEIELHGGRIDASYICFHRPDEGCSCRKPAPGMILQARAKLGISLSDSHLIGDALTDLQAAWAVGMQGILVLTGRGASQMEAMGEEDRARSTVVADLAEWVDRMHSKQLTLS